MSSAQETVVSKSYIFSKMGKKTYLILFLVLLLFVVIIYFYEKNLGKNINYQMNKMKSLIDGSEKEIDKVGISLEYEEPEMEEISSPPIAKKCKNKTKKIKKAKQVFNISDNIYTYYDAIALCKAYNSDLATYKQMVEAYKNKAEWCNYGWTKGQMALYPTQKCTWEKLQQGPKKHRFDCGRPGLNGGYFENPYLRFGVNCYGYKPYPTSKEKEIVKLSTNPYLTQKEQEFKTKVDYYKSRKNDYMILPFRKDKWSEV